MSTSYKLKPTYIRDNYFSAFVRDESVYRTNFRGVCINVRNSYNTGSRRDIFAVKLFAFEISICFFICIFIPNPAFDMADYFLCVRYKVRFPIIVHGPG